MALASLDGMRAGAVAEARRQMARLDERVRRQDDGALDGVAQLAHVAGPVVAARGGEHRRRRCRDVALVLAVHVLEQDVGDERGMSSLCSRSGGMWMLKTLRR